MITLLIGVLILNMLACIALIYLNVCKKHVDDIKKLAEIIRDMVEMNAQQRKLGVQAIEELAAYRQMVAAMLGGNSGKCNNPACPECYPTAEKMH